MWDLVIPRIGTIRPDTAAEPWLAGDRICVGAEGAAALAVAAAAVPRAQRLMGGHGPEWVVGEGEEGALVLLLPATLAEGHYRIDVTAASVRIYASSVSGWSGGLATVVQGVLLLSGSCSPASQKRALPAVQIEDYPQHEWRGFMLDVARHFFPISVLHNVLDVLWLLRLNRFHLHLTDDQGWRLPVSEYPQLTSVGAWRSDQTSEEGQYGGSYTARELRDLDEEARALGIVVVPEIDLPGHASAAITAYPELGVTGVAPGVETRWGIFPAVLDPCSSVTRDFITHVFAAAGEIFRGDYIHIGGDEVLTEQWAPYLQEDRTSADLFQEIVRYMAETVLHLGKTPIAWDEAATLDLPRQTVIANWRGPEAAQHALSRGYRVILCPEQQKAYLDHKHLNAPGEAGRLNVCTVRESASFEPWEYCSSQVGAKGTAGILGGQGNLWTEGVQTERNIEYMAYLRLAALSEGLWTGQPGAATWDQSFRNRLQHWRSALFQRGKAVYPGAMEA
jgi:hexosaminidase